MKNIFIAGGAGYIGSACTEYMLNKGYQVTVFDSLVTGHEKAVDKRATFIRGDLADREKLIEIFRNGSFDAVMHFAAFSLVGESMKDPGKYIRNNLANAINLADAAVEGKVQAFVFSSTAATFGEPREIPISETAEQLPINPYGESKLCFEKVLKWYSRIYGLKYVALRYFNAAGATENFGEYHHPESHPRSGHYNLGTGAGLSVKEILDTARKVTGHPIPADVVPRRPGDPPRLIACSNLAKKELGWKPEFENAGAIIQSVWNWLQKHPDGYGDR